MLYSLSNHGNLSHRCSNKVQSQIKGDNVLSQILYIRFSKKSNENESHLRKDNFHVIVSGPDFKIFICDYCNDSLTLVKAGGWG